MRFSPRCTVADCWAGTDRWGSSRWAPATTSPAAGTGGGTPLAPDARPDDGLVDVVVVSATGPLQRVAFATSLPQGEHLDRVDVHLLRGSRIRVGAGDAPLNVDGELVGRTGTRRWGVEHLSWSLLVPLPDDSP